MKKIMKLHSVLFILGILFLFMPMTTFAAPPPRDNEVVALVYETGDTEEMNQSVWWSDFVRAWNDAATKVKNGKNTTIVFYADWFAGGGDFSEEDLLGFYDGALSVPEGATLTVDLNNHIIDREVTNEFWVGRGEVFEIKKNGNVIIKNGILSGGFANDRGGGIYMNDNCTLTLENVIVTNNQSSSVGAGISMTSNSKLDMKNSHIVKNTAVSKGGGIYVDGENCLIALSQGSEILENNAGTNGGGIYVNADSCTIRMESGGKIDGNTAGGQGGGIYINEENCSIIGGSISSNVSVHDGGGIYVNEDEATITNVMICDNIVQVGNGGGILFYNEKCLVSSCTITGNEARWSAEMKEGKSGYGGGIYVDNNRNNFYQCIITDNTAGAYGGGVYVNPLVHVGVSGVTTIKNNRVWRENETERAENLFLDNGSYTMAYLTDVPFKGSEVYLSTGSDNLTVFKRALLENSGVYDASVFIPDNQDTGCVVYWDYNTKTKEGSGKLYITNQMNQVPDNNNFELKRNVVLIVVILLGEIAIVSIFLLYRYRNGIKRLYLSIWDWWTSWKIWKLLK